MHYPIISLKRTHLAPILEVFRGDTRKRAEVQGDFLSRLAENVNGEPILDLAMGSGVDAIALANNGYKVQGNEVDLRYRLEFTRRATRLGVRIKTLRLRWESMRGSVLIPSNYFGMLYSLGNSFPTYLKNSRRIRMSCLYGFRRILQARGYLVFDSRNYDYIRSNWQTIATDPIQKFRYHAKSTYLANDKVAAFPYHFDGSDAWFIWIDKVHRTYATGRLTPVERGTILQELRDAGFQVVDIVYDYGRSRTENYDFVQFICRK